MNGEQTQKETPTTETGSKLSAIHRKRLLNVARALREDPDPERFTMAYFSSCGTPACALGHYAFRKDLQKTFYLRKERGWLGLVKSRKEDLGIDSDHVLDHFGIEMGESEELFGDHGCGGAKTPIEAATYIEKFVERHS